MEDGIFVAFSKCLIFKTRIARVIRQRHNEELSRQIAAHLEENGFKKIPSKSTILKVLRNMPSATAKELRGINATVENSRRAFTLLEKVIDSLRPIAAQNAIPGLTGDSLDNLSHCVGTARNYFKCHFVYNLAKGQLISKAVFMASHAPKNPEIIHIF